MKGRSLLALVVLFVLVPGVASWAAEKLKIATSVREVPLYILPILASEDAGFFKQQGLEVEFFPFTAGPAMHQGVAAGSIDMGIAGAITVIQAVSRGLPEIIVADMQAENPFSLWLPADSPIKGPGDLKGTRIAVTRFGGTLHAYGRAMTKALGLERDIRFVAAGGVPAMQAALKAKNVEGLMGDIATVAPLKFLGQVRELISSREYLPRQWPDLVVYSRTEFAEKKPRVVGATIRAVLQGGEYAQRNEAWAIEKMKSFLRYPEGLARMYYPMVRYGRDGKIDPKGLENVRNFLIEYSIIRKDKAPPVEKLYTKEFTG